MGYYKQIERNAVLKHNRFKNKKYILFTCVRKKDKEILQGIEYSNGTHLVGYDCWRTLNKADCCDYPFQKYSSREHLEKDCYMIKEFKAYYMQNKEVNVC